MFRMERVTPAQAWKSGIIPVRGDPLRSGFHGKGSEIGIADQIAFGPGSLTELSKYPPMLPTWGNDDARIVVAQPVCQLQCKTYRRGIGINPRVRDDSHHSA